MKKLFTLIALMTVFMGAKAVEIVDAFVDFSTVTEIPRFGWGGSESAFARLSLQDGCLHFHSEEATDPSWDCQFFPIGGVDAEPGVVYTLHYKVKGDHTGGVSMLGFGQTPYGQFQITTDWVEGTVDYECTEANGNILMQCGDWVGTWDIAYLKITHEGKEPTPIKWNELLQNGDAEKSWAELGLADVESGDTENNYKVCFWVKEHGLHGEDGNAAVPAGIEELPEGGHAFVCHAQVADTEGDPGKWDNQVWFESPRSWKTGEQFRLTFRYKASKATTVPSQFHKQNPGDYLHWQAIGNIEFGTDWKEFEQIVTVPAEANGAWSIALNLNDVDREAMDFYFDDITWSEMVLEHGLFITGSNPGFVDYDFDAATEFVYDEAMDAMAATVGTAGNKESWVTEVMISTVRGNDRQFKANTIKNKGAVIASVPGDEAWVDFEEGNSAKIKLPAAGVWNVYVDQSASVMAFFQVEGDSPREPEEIVANPNEIVIKTVERDWLPATAQKDADGKEILDADGNKVMGPAAGEEGIGEGQPWDNQFFLIAKRALEVGEEVFVSFDYMATAPATVGTQNSQDAGGYLHWAGLGNIEFTTEWQHFEATVTIPGETAGKQNSWTFNLSNAKAANEYHFKNIIFCNGSKDESLIDMVTENEANFQMKVGANTPAVPTGIKTVNTTSVKTNAMYNLAGQRVSKDFKGIAIKNGQKFIVK